MTTLRQALDMTSWRRLRAIGRRRGLRLSSNIRKADLVDRLTQALSDPDNLSAVLADLSEQEQRTLGNVLSVGGRLPRRYLRSASLERLYTLGLIFDDRATDDVFVPADLIPHLPTLVHPPPPPPAPAQGDYEPALIAAHDLACLLALLQRDDVRPLHRRWLPPRVLADWGERCALPSLHPGARGELQTGRRRFLHYLAEAARLVGLAGPYLKPTPTAWTWLEAAPIERLNALWEAFVTPDSDRWCAYRLPGHDLTPHPGRLVAALGQALPDLNPADPIAFAETLLSREPALRDLLPSNLLEVEEELGATIVDLLMGPLVWLGALAEGERDSDSDSRHRSSLSVTAWGASWLGMAPPPEVPPPPQFGLTAELPAEPADETSELDGTLLFTLTGALADPAHLMCLEVCAEPERNSDRDRDRDGDSETRYRYRCRTYRVTAASFVRALHQGWSAPALLDALNHLAERPLTGRETAKLRGWAELADRATIRRLAVLETTDPEVISRLASSRRGRSLIVRTLSPRAVVVDDARLDQLARRLSRQEGVPPRIAIARGGSDSESRDRSSLSLSGAAHAWLALKVYQGLGEFIRLPAHTPQALLDHLASLADPDDLAAAETGAEATLAALQEAVVGRAVFPPWPEDGLPVEESLAIIEEALAGGYALEMDYYTAGRDVLTQRVMEPYRLEQRGDIHYLVGFCRRAQAERVFRVDRIRRIKITKSDDEKE